MPIQIKSSKKVQKRAHKKVQKKNSLLNFDKYDLYRRSVQSPDTDAEFMNDVYVEVRGKKPKVLREDFCGTFLISTEWIKLGSTNKAIGVDLDPEPIDYGKQKYLSKLKPGQIQRMQILEDNVLSKKLPHADIVCALNFSYFIFKKRDELKKYFSNVLGTLNRGGIFVVDLFGGSQCQDAIEDRTPHKNFAYYWDQVGFDPVSHEALFYIHFRVGGKKVEKVFTYDWRLWSIPEIREIMESIGFKKTHVYWEGTNKDGSGNGVFKRAEKGEACLSWIAYIVAES